MYDDDLEKTRALNELSELNTNEEVIKEVSTSDTNEFNLEEKEALFNDLTREEQVIKEETSIENKEEKKKKENLIDKFKKLPKKNKIIIICGIVFILLLIVGLVIFFVIADEKKEEKKEELPNVVLAKDNYKYQDGILTILDDNDNTLGTYECDNKDENKCFVAYINNDEDTFNAIKKVYEDGSIVKQRSQAILNRYVFIYDNESLESNKIKLYDMLNNKVLDEYLGVKQYDVETKNIVVLKNSDNKYGVVKFDESSVTNMFEFVYNYIGIMDKAKDNMIIVKNDKGYYLADYTNDLKTRAFNGEIIDYNDEYVIVKQANSKYSIFDYKGEEIIKDYDYISIINDKLIACVNDNHLFIKDFDNNKYNEEGLELTNNDYFMTYTFDDKNKLISTTYAYQFELHDNTLTVKLQNADKTSREERIDLKEGEISQKYKNYSYFNGKLYFYEEENKNKVLATYECRNKNSLTGDSLTNCYVANNSEFSNSYITPKKNNNSVIPIYNSRYAFIYDVSDLNSETNVEIKFYDFKDNKLLGTYSAVDTDVDVNVNDLTYKNTESSSIIVKLKSGKFGVIDITREKASVNQNLNFEYDYIERANKDYVVKSSDGRWKIIYDGGSYSSASFPGKILNYANAYVVVQVDNKVYLYNGDGSEFSKVKDGFDYIDISNKNAFGAVSNNKLKVFDYDGNLLSTDSITLVSPRAFKLSANESGVEVKIYDADGNVKQTINYNINKNKEVEKENEE